MYKFMLLIPVHANNIRNQVKVYNKNNNVVVWKTREKSEKTGVYRLFPIDVDGKP